MKNIALITGSNRGLGFESCRQLGHLGYHVILTCRDPIKGEAAVAKLLAEKLSASFIRLDVTNDESVEACAAQVRRDFGMLHILVNNAGILLDTDYEVSHGPSGDSSALRVPISVIRETLETNLYGAYRMCQKFAPLLVQTAELPDSRCRIVNVSSGMGQLSEMNGGYPAYRFSKTALNALTRVFAEELSNQKILVNSICPGWVKTDMGGAGAELTPQQGADTIVWAATLPVGGPTGGFFREREAIDW